VYLYNFGKFVRWSPGSRAVNSRTFVVCVLGTDPFGPVLDMVLQDETINGKPAQAKRPARAADASDCSIVFISDSESSRLPQVLSWFDGGGVLTVSDMDRFADRGGMIQFVWDGRRVRFELNRTAAAQAGLTFSADLLNVALRVRP
jgi:hypothetical protein